VNMALGGLRYAAVACLAVRCTRSFSLHSPISCRGHDISLAFTPRTVQLTATRTDHPSRPIHQTFEDLVVTQPRDAQGDLEGRLGHVLVRNTQRKYAIDVARLETQTRAILEVLNCANMDVGIWLTTDASVRQLNAQYRGKKKSTDILSFPFHEFDEPGTLPPMESEDDMNLGDMVISVAYVDRACQRDARDAAKMGQAAWHSEQQETRGVSGEMMKHFGPEARLPLLLVHGLCHLVGHDHENDEDYERMVSLEEDVIKELTARDLLAKHARSPHA